MWVNTENISRDHESRQYLMTHHPTPALPCPAVVCRNNPFRDEGFWELLSVKWSSLLPVPFLAIDLQRCSVAVYTVYTGHTVQYSYHRSITFTLSCTSPPFITAPPHHPPGRSNKASACLCMSGLARAISLGFNRASNVKLIVRQTLRILSMFCDLTYLCNPCTRIWFWHRSPLPGWRQRLYVQTQKHA